MSNPTINDNEMNKFKLSDIGDVYVDTVTVTIDALHQPTGTINDLELKKITTAWKVRVVLTV